MKNEERLNNKYVHAIFLLQVLQSDGLDRTRELAREHCDSALSAIEPLTDSKYKWALASLTDYCLNRLKWINYRRKSEIYMHRYIATQWKKIRKFVI